MALLLACATFPLIWVGGLVTTYDAGMAVPDWPGTYGYNLFLYPWQSWVAGPWDLCMEHGHRLLGALAGLLTIGLVVAVYRFDRRVWLRRLAIVALIAVVLQGCLGGARVLLDARQLAMIHGCAGPAFFALCVAICVFTSRTWRSATSVAPVHSAPRLHRLSIAMAIMAFVQLILGALLRHVPTSASPGFFELAVYSHLIFAGVVTLLVGCVAWMVFRGPAGHGVLRFPAWALVVLIVVQLSLGCATWVVNYYWPSWTPEWDWVAAYQAIESKGLVQTMIVTAHQATGSLVLGVSVLMTLRAMRVVRGEPAPSRLSAKALKGSAA
jgi:cytochrome c oxidase assembly protein subunit 15